MLIDSDLLSFIASQAHDHPAPRDPNDFDAYISRYAAMSRKLPSVLVPVNAGDFKLRGTGKSIRARLHWPNGAVQPLLMVWFVGGGWCAGGPWRTPQATTREQAWKRRSDGRFTPQPRGWNPLREPRR